MNCTKTAERSQVDYCIVKEINNVMGVKVSTKWMKTCMFLCIRLYSFYPQCPGGGGGEGLVNYFTTKPT